VRRDRGLSLFVGNHVMRLWPWSFSFSQSTLEAGTSAA
jgi:hypothetical protein